ncbi:MAG: hypothetical protein JWL79_2418 [Frankiales bacterium]|nr:hypothetical protein [Frankiales bacterium]
MRKTTKLVAAVGASALVVGSAGIAYAYWTSTGTGAGTASTSAGDAGTAEFIKIVQNTTLADMYPGDSAQSFTAKVSNISTDGSKVYVSSVKAYLTVVPIVAGTCDATDYLLNGQSTYTAALPATLHWTAVELSATGVGSSQDTASGDTIQFNNKPSTPQNGCKSAAVTIHYVAS